MGSETVSTTLSTDTTNPSPGFNIRQLATALRNSLIVVAIMLLLALILEFVLGPAIASTQVEQTVTNVLTRLLIFLMPFAAYIVSSGSLREFAKKSPAQAIIAALIATAIIYAILSVGNFVFKSGPFAPRASLQFTLETTEEGALVTDIVPGGAAELAELQVGDVITGIRRDSLTASDLQKRIAASEVDAPLRLRLIRDGEEMQLTARTVLITEPNINALTSGLVYCTNHRCGGRFLARRVDTLRHSKFATRSSNLWLYLACHRDVFI